jgi:hypothetical protein
MTRACLKDTYLVSKGGPEELRHIFLGRVGAVYISKMMSVQALDHHMSAVAVHYCMPHHSLRPVSKHRLYLPEKRQHQSDGEFALAYK